MPIKPPPTYRRRRAPLAAAARRATRGGRRETAPRILSRAPQPTTGTGRIVPQILSQTPQPTTGARPATGKAPPRTLGSAHYKGDVFTGQTGVNQGRGGANIEASQATGRVGKKFKVGFTPDGRIIHLYGSDVAAGARRQVLNNTVNPTMIRAAQRRGRVVRT